MDPLSDLLRIVRLTGAYFYQVEATEPWSVETIPASQLSPRILPTADHLISYHVLTAGSCFAGLIGEEQYEMVPGDVIVFPHGDPHVVASKRGLRVGRDLMTATPARYPFTMNFGSQGPDGASFVCGFLGCDLRPFNPLLATLPRVIHMRGLPDATLGSFVRQVTEETAARRAGGDIIITRLAELMFIEVLRRHLDTLPEEQTGWLAGLRDVVVGRALTQLHARPSHPWTLADLAKESNSSRSNLAKRFTEMVGQPPMAYLTQWRLQVAANLLAQSGIKISAVAAEVGYDSEAAFSRAFKKSTGQAPGAWRVARRTARL